MTLRSRFTLAVAGAVAAVALAITAVAFLVVRVRPDQTSCSTNFGSRRPRCSGWPGITTGRYPPDGSRRTPTGSAGRVRTRRW